MGRQATSSLYYCGRRRRWFYAFFVTGAAAFLVTLPFVAKKPTVFQAEAWVTPPQLMPTRGELNTVAQLTSRWREALPEVVQRVTGQKWSNAELDRLAHATTMREVLSGKGNDYDVLLTLGWDGAQIAEQLVRALAEELCERKNRELPTPASASNDGATATRQCAEILRDEAREEVAEVKHVIAEHDKRTAAAEELAHPKKEAPAALVVNPDWERLERELEKLDAQRLRMLEIYTAQHPLIANLTAQRDELEARLARTPQQVAGGPKAAPPEGSSPIARPAPSKVTLAERQRLVAQLQARQGELADAEELVRQSLESENQTRSAPPHAPESRWQFAKYSEAEARVGAQFAFPWQRLGLISLLAGSVVALGVVGIRPTYDSAAEAFARLPVLVVGVIPAEGPVHRPVSIRTWAARLVALCEWSMIAVAVFLALAVWKNPHFGQRLLADPLTVLATPGDWIPWLRR